MADNIRKEGVAASRITAQEAGLEVVGLGGEIYVGSGQIELRTVFLQRIILEDAEGHVLIAIVGDLGRNQFAVGYALINDTDALSEQCEIVPHRLIQCFL